MEVQVGALIRRSGTSPSLWRVVSVEPTGQVHLVNIDTGRKYQAGNAEKARFIKA